MKGSNKSVHETPKTTNKSLVCLAHFQKYAECHKNTHKRLQMLYRAHKSVHETQKRLNKVGYFLHTFKNIQCATKTHTNDCKCYTELIKVYQ